MKKILFLFSLLITVSLGFAQTDTTVVGFTVSADPAFRNTIAVDVIWSGGSKTSFRGTATDKITGAYGSIKYGTINITYSASGTKVIGPKKDECL